MSDISLVYVAFDRCPAPKGAATHISAVVAGLAARFKSVDLITVSGSRTSQVGALTHTIPGLQHTELPALGPTLIERVLSFRTQLRAWWRDRRPSVAHVRSIYEGYPIARDKRRWCDQLVFEVNGLPSIELKYHYPQVADDRELMCKLIAQEQCCLDAADLVITVSEVNARHLLNRGVEANRLVVIPNGVDTEIFTYRTPQPLRGREIRLLYSGTLSRWQGVHVAIEALGLYRREGLARLTIVGAGRPDQIRSLREMASRWNVDEHLQILEPVTQWELARLHHEADVVLVPLMPNDRNLIQGCCPLKLLEGMASGTPVIASEMPVTSEIAENNISALLVRPGSAKAIKEALIRMIQEPALLQTLSVNARQRIDDRLTWKHSNQHLFNAYRKLD
ncbi:MAG: glycosyltransferase family 4 protein [Schlesneria sp.]